MKGLPGLIRLHQWKVDEQRRKVTELETLAENLSNEIGQIQAQIMTEGKVTAEDFDASQAFSAFLKGALIRRDRLRESIQELQGQISEARDELADAFRELKSYEIAQANRDRHAARKRELQDRVKMDEIGLGLYRRRQSEPSIS